MADETVTDEDRDIIRGILPAAPSDPLGDLRWMQLVEQLSRALSAARQSGAKGEWVPTSQPPTEMVQAVGAWRSDPNAEQTRIWWNGAAWFCDERGGMLDPPPDYYLVIPSLPDPTEQEKRHG